MLVKTILHLKPFYQFQIRFNASFFAPQYENAMTMCHLFSRRRYLKN